MTQQITIPISESDAGSFQELALTQGDSITWTFTTDQGIDVDVLFVNDYDFQEDNGEYADA
jgi:hypothetical protein